ncbi:hypothetical protein DL89DRAFT_39616 [Linderina pennispora]|uniref:Uncharacterized protein n=1 Tax=Linderina pennispora TaxID=61395 RepID=A0A1Y1W392_9FUNG|nr:uncharacterized protein DL89DRAFT_39616 [Linderina pennispora]ORX67990.1 hypothetical protein DL89DRAFT_39616 [Linderina pennispora]
MRSYPVVLRQFVIARGVEHIVALLHRQAQYTHCSEWARSGETVCLNRYTCFLCLALCTCFCVSLLTVKYTKSTGQVVST